MIHIDPKSSSSSSSFFRRCYLSKRMCCCLPSPTAYVRVCSSVVIVVLMVMYAVRQFQPRGLACHQSLPPFNAVHTCSISHVDFVFIFVLPKYCTVSVFVTTLYPLSPRMSWCTAYYSLIIVGESASSSPFFSRS